MKTEADQSTKERVFQCIVQLCNYSRAATRPKIVTLTGLKIALVDDAVKALIQESRIVRVTDGVFEVVHEFPPDQLMTVSVTPSGKYKIEHGDQCWSLNPTEAGMLGMLLEGKARELAQRHNQLDTELRIARLEVAAKRARKLDDALAQKVATMEARGEAQLHLEI